MSYEIEASEWINTKESLSLQALRGRVVVVTVFQMLCQGCAQFSLPQARNVHTMFSRDDLVLVGLHSVFEHHHVMTPEALRVFASEYRLAFPIAIDRAREHSPIPATMHEWALNGTPSLMVFDRDGGLALRHFGHLDDLHLGAVLGQLIAGPSAGAANKTANRAEPGQGAGSGPVCSA